MQDADDVIADAAPRSGPTAETAPRRVRRVNLALQGGGAHGAFTWGALDRLMEQENLEVEGVTATSAGAMNGAMFTTGFKLGGREGARIRLRQFWEEIRASYVFNSPPWSVWLQALFPFGVDYNPAYMMSDAMSRLLSPYQFNPANINPLRELLENLIDFEQVCRSDNPRLFVCATDVQSGRAHVFKGEKISIDALLASACLPFLYQAVRIDGRDYWDGGYTGNPALWPLIYDCRTEDVLIVQINPIERDETPTDAPAIQNRVNEIAFNSNLMSEIRAMDTICKLVGQGKLPPDRYKRMRIHSIDDPETMRTLSVATKLSPAADMLDRLFEAGRAAADRWLETSFEKVGVESSVDLRERYL